MKTKILLLIIFSSLGLKAQNSIKTYYKAIELDKSGNTYQAALLLDSAEVKNDYTYKLEGELWLKNKKFDKAKQAFEKMNSQEKYLWLAKTYAEKQEADSAVNFLKQYLAWDKKKEMPQITLDTSLKKISSSPAWKELWKHKWYSDTQMELDRIAYNINNGNALNQLEQLNAIIEKDKTPRAYFLRSRIYIQTGNLKAAEEDLHKAVTYDNNPEYLKALINLYVKQGKTTEALRTVNRAINLYPYDLSFTLERAKIFEQMQNYNLAANDLKKVYDITGDENTGMELGNLYIKQGEYMEAIKVANKLLDKQEKSDYYNLRGEAFLLSGNNQGAYKDFTMSVDLNPNQPGIYLNIANTAFEIGYKEEACLYWKKCYEQYKDQQAYKMLKIHCRKYLKQ